MLLFPFDFRNFLPEYWSAVVLVASILVELVTVTVFAVSYFFTVNFYLELP
jgi:hypothetical protein